MATEVLQIDSHFVDSTPAGAKLPSIDFPEMAFAGRSNVGKSSLINSLLQRHNLARASNTPGCTRALQRFRVRYKQHTLDFMDLPGYGYARRSKVDQQQWGSLIENYLVQRENLRAVVIIVDIRRGLEEEELTLIDFLKHYNRAYIAVATKVDKLSLNQRKVAVATLRKAFGAPILSYSSKSGEGREALWQTLLRHMPQEVAVP